MKQAFRDVQEFNKVAGRKVGDLRNPSMPEPSAVGESVLGATMVGLKDASFAVNRVDMPGLTEGDKVLLLRARLLIEEASETTEAMAMRDLAGVADGLADLIYVALDAAVAFGIDMGPVWEAVQRANMSKFPTCQVCGGRSTHGDFGDGPEPCGSCGGVGRIAYRDAQGKITKPPGWSPPNIAAVLQAQREA